MTAKTWQNYGKFESRGPSQSFFTVVNVLWHWPQDDGEEFLHTVEAMKVMGINDEDMSSIWCQSYKTFLARCSLSSSFYVTYWRTKHITLYITRTAFGDSKTVVKYLHVLYKQKKLENLEKDAHVTQSWKNMNKLLKVILIITYWKLLITVEKWGKSEQESFKIAVFILSMIGVTNWYAPFKNRYELSEYTYCLCSFRNSYVAKWIHILFVFI